MQVVFKTASPDGAVTVVALGGLSSGSDDDDDDDDESGHVDHDNNDVNIFLVTPPPQVVFKTASADGAVTVVALGGLSSGSAPAKRERIFYAQGQRVTGISKKVRGWWWGVGMTVVVMVRRRRLMMVVSLSKDHDHGDV
jgi:hypothetical protein